MSSFRTPFFYSIRLSNLFADLDYLLLICLGSPFGLFAKAH